MERTEYYANLGKATEYLSHHGVKGQQWGKENGPPYPLDSSGKEALQEQKRKAREAKYKEKETSKAEKKYDKRITKLEKKKEKSISTEYDSKIAFQKAMKKLELEKISNLEGDILKEDMRDRGREIVKTALLSVAAAPLTGLVGVAAVNGVRYKSSNKNMTYNRISENEMLELHKKSKG